MEKTIQLIHDIGYYHPSNANWSYHIHMIIDSKGARLYKETFGGDSRLIATLEAQGYKVERLYAGKGSNVEYKWKNCKDLLDIETYKPNQNY